MRAVWHAASRRALLVEDEQGLEDDLEHRIIGLDGMLLSFALILLVVTAAAAEKMKMPASSAAIVLGAAFGALFRIAGLTQESKSLTTDSLITFDEELFLYVLLPPIIFEAGFSLSRAHFFGNLGTILLFAVLGTLITTMVIGQSIYAAGAARAFSSPSGVYDALDFTTPLDSYLFGALISATDPVATLSIMSAVNADPVVFTLIFGESVLNDAVAIVLVRILEDSALPSQAVYTCPHAASSTAHARISCAPSSHARSDQINAIRTAGGHGLPLTARFVAHGLPLPAISASHPITRLHRRVSRPCAVGDLGFSDPFAYLNGVLAFLSVSLGSLLVGIGVSAASALLLNRFDLTHHRMLSRSSNP